MDAGKERPLVVNLIQRRQTGQPDRDVVCARRRQVSSGGIRKALFAGIHTLVTKGHVEAERIRHLPGIGYPEGQRLGGLQPIIAGIGVYNAVEDQFTIDLVVALGGLKTVYVILMITGTQRHPVLSPFPIEIGLNPL